MRLFGRSPWVLVAGAAFAVLKYFLDKVCLMVPNGVPDGA